MQKVHKRKTDEYEDICMYYDKYRPRLSRLMREQQELANPEPFIE